MDSTKQAAEKGDDGDNEVEGRNEDASSNEQQRDDEPPKEVKKSSKKRTGARKNCNDGVRKRPSSTSGVPIRKRRKVVVEIVEDEYDSKLDKNTESTLETVQAKDDKHRNFKCDKCGSPFITNPMKRGNKVKKSELTPSPRHKLDPETKKILSLCNACGLGFNRPKKIKKVTVPPSAEEKQKYIDGALNYADYLMKELGSEEASRLCCTYYTKTPCGCIQRYIGDGKCKESLERARNLLKITSQARKYKSMKVCLNSQDISQKESQEQVDDNSEIINSKGQKKFTKRIKSGLGNGQKKSKLFEKYVLEQRAYLKKNHGFCETGTKRILLYSNNFLHKRLKTNPEQQCRVVRQKGKIALGQLSSIKDLPKKNCCIDKCVRMALTHQTLLEEWREKSKRGQAEARRVIAEMLTPSGGSRTNCYKFISWVTGRSLTTIGKVNDQMKKTGGNREPPEHGLKEYWKKYRKPKKEKAETKPTSKSTTNVFSHDVTTSVIPALIQPLGILQAAVNSSGLTAVIQSQQQQQQQQQQQPIQQQQQTQINQTGNSSIIAMQPSFVLQTIQGNAHAIPVNQLQQLQLLQLLQQQQQQNSQITVATNPAANITRQQLATAPTMVSNSSQQNTFVITPATPHIIGSVNDSSVSPILTANIQQSPPTNTSQQNVQPQAQYLHISPVATATQGPFLLQSSLPGFLNLAPPVQASVLPSTGNFNIPPSMNISIASSGNINVVSTLASTGSLNIASSGNMNQITSNSLSLLPQMTSSAGADQFISGENTMTIYSTGNINNLLGAQPVQLISQTVSSNLQRNTTSFDTSFITSG